MCDHSAYFDPLPDIALEALKNVSVRPEFVSRSEEGEFTMEVKNAADREKAFTALAAVVTDEDWSRLHLSGPFHSGCLHCIRKKKPLDKTHG